jgi:hypothetical protein
MSRRICRKSGIGANFIRVLRFPLPIFIPPPAPHSSSISIIRGWYNRPNSGRGTKWTQSHPTPSNLKNYSPLQVIDSHILSIPVPKFKLTDPILTTQQSTSHCKYSDSIEETILCLPNGSHVTAGWKDESRVTHWEALLHGLDAVITCSNSAPWRKSADLDDHQRVGLRTRFYIGTTMVNVYLPVPGSSCASVSTLRPHRLRKSRDTRLSEQTSNNSRVRRRIPRARSITKRRFLQNNASPLSQSTSL